MKYCSNCGNVVTLRWVGREGRERYVCAACGITHYQNPSVIVRCIVHCRDKVLMCQRAHEPARGQWELPSGYLELGETLEQGAARETYEETGVVINPRDLDLYSLVSMTELKQVAISFRMAFATEPPILCGSECLDVAFMAEGQVAPSQLAWIDSMGDGPKRLFQELRSNQFGIHLLTLESPRSHRATKREYPNLVNQLTFNAPV